MAKLPASRNRGGACPVLPHNYPEVRFSKRAGRLCDVDAIGVLHPFLQIHRNTRPRKSLLAEGAQTRPSIVIYASRATIASALDRH